jgi:hypothetical protein
MINPKLELTIFVAVTIALALIISPIVNEYVLAVKKSSSVKTSGKTSSIQINGVKVLKVHTVPSKVKVGSTFGLRGIVINNSTATITFANGTCTSPLSITFDKNVINEPKTTTAPCQAQQVTLKPGEQTHILSPKLSGITYKATSPGITNATMIFKFQAAPLASKSSVSESYNRVYTFNIMPPGTTPTASTSPPTPTTTHSHSPAHIIRSAPSSQPGLQSKAVQ